MEQLQAMRAAFLRVKLRSPHAIGDNHTAERRAIIGDRRHTLLVLRLDVVRMREVETGFLWNTGKDRQKASRWPDRVPAHMRNLRATRNRAHFTAKEPQSIHVALGMIISQQLHTETNAQERLTSLRRQPNSNIQSPLPHARH